MGCVMHKLKISSFVTDTFDQFTLVFFQGFYLHVMDEHIELISLKKTKEKESDEGVIFLLRVFVVRLCHTE